MNQNCPKCGHWDSHGPFYTQEPVTGREYLVYICSECGAKSKEKTLEQKRMDEKHNEKTKSLFPQKS